MPSDQAAAILGEMASDHVVDVLGEMDQTASLAILAKMDRKDAEDAKMMLEYAPDCAGGLMISEFLSYRDNLTIQDVLDDLQTNREAYADFNVQYIYITDSQEKLVGVLRMHDLLFPARETRLSQVMIPSPLSIPDKASLKVLEEFFEEHHLFGVPVVDDGRRLVGVVLPEAIEEAVNKRKTKTFLRLSGIIGGEEFRTMPLLSRSGRRLSWLSMNIVLNIVAASVIALYQDTLAAVITLAVFLPMVSDMSGCSGNQAVAVSMRELSLGLVRPGELIWVLAKESRLSRVMISSPLSVLDQTPLRQLEEFFEEHPLFGVPVVDIEQRLVGVVLPEDIEEAVNKRKTKNFLRLSGIIGGEEFRTMPLLSRSGRRLSWLSMNIVLNIIAASVIALYQDTLSAVIVLAVFLPMVSDMSGCSGNQAVAVSMRELSLGLVRPGELLWVVAKETRVGIINGVVLGILLGGVAYLWKGNPWLGLVVGGALAANTLVSVILGGMLPLILKRVKLDPALVSSPLLTTVTDMCGFFFVLSFAAMVLPRLGGI
jgi:Mg/Co/Ni transporter MgtE